MHPAPGLLHSEAGTDALCGVAEPEPAFLNLADAYLHRKLMPPSPSTPISPQACFCQLPQHCKPSQSISPPLL